MGLAFWIVSVVITAVGNHWTKRTIKWSSLIFCFGTLVAIPCRSYQVGIWSIKGSFSCTIALSNVANIFFETPCNLCPVAMSSGLANIHPFWVTQFLHAFSWIYRPITFHVKEYSFVYKTLVCFQVDFVMFLFKNIAIFWGNVAYWQIKDLKLLLDTKYTLQLHQLYKFKF